MQAANKYMKQFSHIEDIHRRIFAGMLTHLDDSVGSVISQLQESGVEENTLVVFLSDNGGPTKELTSRNDPLRGGKGELYEGGIRVPLIVSWKGRIPARREDTPVISMDLTMTALESAGVRVAEDKFDGLNLMPLLTRSIDELPPRDFFWRMGQRHAIRSGKWKLIGDNKTSQLYDLDADISETNDLAASQPERVEQLTSLWDSWNAEQIEPLWK